LLEATIPTQFANPRPQFFNSTPTVYANGKLNYYAAGTSTRLDTYSDSALSSANVNPVVLNSAGRPDVSIYMQDATYKVVLTDSSDTVIWTVDNYHPAEYAFKAKVRTYAGNPNGNAAGTAGTPGTIHADVIWDDTNDILYICTTTGVAAAAVWTAVNAASATPAVTLPQGRLTLTSATPVLAADVSAATAVYYTPYVGELVPLYNGTSTVPTEFAELTLTLAAQHAVSTIYDVFVFSNSSVLTLATGPAWSNSGAGATLTSQRLLGQHRLDDRPQRLDHLHDRRQQRHLSRLHLHRQRRGRADHLPHQLGPVAQVRRLECVQPRPRSPESGRLNRILDLHDVNNSGITRTVR
jgi:hypothetical protein